MNYSYNALVKLVDKNLSTKDSQAVSHILERLSSIVGANGAVVGESLEERLHSIFNQSKSIGGDESVSIAEAVGMPVKDVFTAILSDVKNRVPAESMVAKPKAAKNTTAKNTTAATPRYGSTTAIANSDRTSGSKVSGF